MTLTGRALALAGLVLVACRAHPDGAVAITQDDCASCHMPEYLGASEPVHVDRMPETCADCHSNQAWQPAVGLGHPEVFFPIASGDHSGITCIQCHDPGAGSSTGGANTDCIGCHTGAHEQARMDDVHGGVSDYRFDSQTPNFCLSCHPDGQAADHPDDRFPLGGAHGGVACGDCHDDALGPSTGGQNVSCIGCHTGEHSMTRMDDKHHEVSGYSWQADDPDFCRRCHPRGLAED
jgi:hypothetical protein